MKDHVRAAIASIARASHSGASPSAIYDFSKGKHRIISGSYSDGAVNAYDHEIGAHISGTMGNLYHFGEGAHIQITMNGNSFTGYDFGSGYHFSGNVNGSNVTVYDFESSQHYSYA